MTGVHHNATVSQRRLRVLRMLEDCLLEQANDVFLALNYVELIMSTRWTTLDVDMDVSKSVPKFFY